MNSNHVCMNSVLSHEDMKSQTELLAPRFQKSFGVVFVSLSIICLLALMPNLVYSDDLHSAAARNQTAKITKLLDKGKNIHVTDKKGLQPLHHAARGGHTQAIDLLLSRGANINARTLDICRSSACGGDTPLHFAAKGGHTLAVTLLLDRGADVMAIEDLLGFTPLHSASAHGQVEVVKLLLARGAKVNAEGKGNSYFDIPAMRPLDIALKNQHSVIAEILRAAGAAASPSRTPLRAFKDVIPGKTTGLDVKGWLGSPIRFERNTLTGDEIWEYELATGKIVFYLSGDIVQKFVFR